LRSLITHICPAGGTLRTLFRFTLEKVPSSFWTPAIAGEQQNARACRVIPGVPPPIIFPH
jgi:hypothetical protein